MYLFIDEEGNVFTGDRVGSGDLSMAAEGIMDIIDLKNRLQFDGDEWVDIPAGKYDIEHEANTARTF
jgi:hypothetical protein